MTATTITAIAMATNNDDGKIEKQESDGNTIAINSKSTHKNRSNGNENDNISKGTMTMMAQKNTDTQQ